MYTFEKRIFIKRPQQEVFEFVTNPANSTQWQRTTISSEWTSDGSPGVGSKIKSVIKLFGRPIEGEVEVTEWEPYNAYGYKGSGGSFQVAGKVWIEPKGGGTQVTLNGQVSALGFFKLLERLVGRQAEKQDGSNYDALKLLLETS